MALTFTREGSIFDSKVDALVNPVNCVGVMGAGLALEFAKRYPVNLAAYQLICKGGVLAPGELHVRERTEGNPPRYIINAATKLHWRQASQLVWIKDCTRRLRELSDRKQWSLAIPALGCGRGGLSWKEVKPLFIDAFQGTQLTIIVYEPAN